ncbi:MAG: hypothetical protein ITF99_05010 [Chryseobacterium sp.]|nr:hypothetical protein [Chryseobacterium sp.]
MKKHFLYFLFLFSTSFAFAQTAEPETSPCPNPKKLRGLCGFVGDRTPDDDSQGNFKYIYQRKIYEAACVDPTKDSEEEIRSKIANVWNANEATLICSNTQFDTTKGSLIKYAISMQFDMFIYDVVDWKVNFNKIDETDGKTVLDYLDDKIKQNKGNAVEKGLREYYLLLKKAGAKHKSEL